jgi:DNA-binding NarL/FixJ family response regulator
VELAGFYRPDVVVLDVGLSEVDGLEAAGTIYERSPSTCIVLLATTPDDEQALRALRAGATGYLAKDLDPTMLPRVLRGVIDGEAAISRRLTMSLVESYRRAPRGGAGLRPVRSTLTDREWEVLDLLSAGAGTEDIARSLVLSTETVRSHLKNLYRKLEVRSREEAVQAARRLRELVS